MNIGHSVKSTPFYPLLASFFSAFCLVPDAPQGSISGGTSHARLCGDPVRLRSSRWHTEGSSVVPPGQRTPPPSCSCPTGAANLLRDIVKAILVLPQLPLGLSQRGKLGRLGYSSFAGFVFFLFFFIFFFALLSTSSCSRRIKPPHTRDNGNEIPLARRVWRLRLHK